MFSDLATLGVLLLLQCRDQVGKRKDTCSWLRRTGQHCSEIEAKSGSAQDSVRDRIKTSATQSRWVAGHMSA